MHNVYRACKSKGILLLKITAVTRSEGEITIDLYTIHQRKYVHNTGLCVLVFCFGLLTASLTYMFQCCFACDCPSVHRPLTRYVKLRMRMRRECRERFPRHRGLAIPTCITARAWRTCRDACRDRYLAISYKMGGGGKTFPAFPAHAQPAILRIW